MRVWISKFLRSPVFLMVIGGVATLVLLLVVVWLLWRTGGAKAVSDNAAVIGALIALGGVFTAQMVSIALEDQRTRETRALEDQRSQDAALQAYFEQMGGLLTEHNLLHTDREYIRQLAEAQTLTVVARLDGSRKRSLMRFLHEAGLINKDEPTVGLSGADLRLAELSGADLSDADLNGADLSNASLKRARLCGTDLSSADLFEARGWTADQLRATRTLEGATMPDGQILQGAAVPNGPTLEEWLKSQGLGEAGEYE